MEKCNIWMTIKKQVGKRLSLPEYHDEWMVKSKEYKVIRKEMLIKLMRIL